MSRAFDSHTNVFAILQANRAGIRSFGVNRMGVFGSFGRGNPDPSSDVDVLVTFKPDQKSFERFIALAEYLEDVLDREVELVTTEALSPHNRERILEEVRHVDLTDEGSR